MKNFYILIFLAFMSCDQKRKWTQDNMVDFEEKARHYFIDSVSANDLDPLYPSDKCILAKDISGHLPELRDSLPLIVDDFAIQQYRSGDARVRFSFVSAHGDNFYFLLLPQFWAYYHSYDYYDFDPRRGQEKLKDSLEVQMAKVDTKELDKFIEREIAPDRDKDEQIEISRAVFPIAFPYLSHITNDEFQTQIDSLPAANAEFVRSRMKEILGDGNSNLDGEEYFADYYHFEPYGTFFFHYYFRTVNDDPAINLDIYFIPKQYSFIWLSDNIRPEFRECFDEDTTGIR